MQEVLAKNTEKILLKKFYHFNKITKNKIDRYFSKLFYRKRCVIIKIHYLKNKIMYFNYY